MLLSSSAGLFGQASSSLAPLLVALARDGGPVVRTKILCGNMRTVVVV